MVSCLQLSFTESETWNARPTTDLSIPESVDTRFPKSPTDAPFVLVLAIGVVKAAALDSCEGIV
jgi:hypothetical protein